MPNRLSLKLILNFTLAIAVIGVAFFLVVGCDRFDNGAQNPYGYGYGYGPGGATGPAGGGPGTPAAGFGPGGIANRWQRCASTPTAGSVLLTVEFQAGRRAAYFVEPKVQTDCSDATTVMYDASATFTASRPRTVTMTMKASLFARPTTDDAATTLNGIRFAGFDKWDVRSRRDVTTATEASAFLTFLQGMDGESPLETVSQQRIRFKGELFDRI